MEGSFYSLIYNNSKVIKMVNYRKSLASLVLLSAGVLSFVSCNLEQDPIPFNAGIDVIVQDIKTDEGVKYAIVVYASANYEIKSAKVTAPGVGGKVYELTDTETNYRFFYIPPTTDYTTGMPVIGDYVFEIVSMGDEKVTGKDVVGAEKLVPIVIKTTSMTNHQLKTTWDKISGADAYEVRLYSENKSELLFSSNLLDDKAEYEFGATSYGWAGGKSPVANTNYVVELKGLKTETGESVDKWSNLQFITVDSKTIKWE